MMTSRNSSPRSRGHACFLALGFVCVFPGALCAAEAAARVFSGGGDVRARNEHTDGLSTLSTTAPGHEQNYFRVRTRLWGAWTPSPASSLNVRVTAEPRYWVRRSSARSFSNRRGLEGRTAVLDVLNFQHRFSAPDLPLAFTVGRQELKLGEAAAPWLVGDATPGDGSTTAYFDAVRATLNFEKLRTTLDLVVIDQQATADRRLPVLGRGDAYPMSEQDEQGVIVYASHRIRKQMQAEAFFIFKKNRRVLATGNDAEISTGGLRLAGDPSPRWQYSFEGALQTGNKQDGSVKIPAAVPTRRDVRAWGVNSRLTWLARDARDQRVSIVGEFLSGDDPKTTGRDELFDVLWGRYPRFSDVIAAGFTTENAALYQMGNLVRIGPEWSLAPTKTSTLVVGWQRLFALEAVPTRATRRAAFSQDGRTRGDYFRATWRQKFSKNVSGLVTGEALNQGDFYAERDVLSFLRVEVAVTF